MRSARRWWGVVLSASVGLAISGCGFGSSPSDSVDAGPPDRSKVVSFFEVVDSPSLSGGPIRLVAVFLSPSEAGELHGYLPDGLCVADYKGIQVPTVHGANWPYGYRSAGDRVEFQFGGQSFVAPKRESTSSTEYPISYVALVPGPADGTATVSWPGDSMSDYTKPFSSALLRMPEPITLQVPASVTRNQPFDLSWTGSGGDFVQIVLTSTQYSYVKSVTCLVRDSGRFTVPASVWQSLNQGTLTATLARSLMSWQRFTNPDPVSNFSGTLAARGARETAPATLTVQ